MTIGCASAMNTPDMKRLSRCCGEQLKPSRTYLDGDETFHCSACHKPSLPMTPWERMRKWMHMRREPICEIDKMLICIAIVIAGALFIGTHLTP
jgi:hypothetical protein